ncbi:MAG: hypothetical protein FWD94_06230 [Treponema sp.]|nr:hypothetical protein [Treponema sp.]
MGKISIFLMCVLLLHFTEEQSNKPENSVENISIEESVSEAVFNAPDEFFIEHIDEKFMGTYLPLRFIESLSDTRNFRTAMLLNHETRINWSNTNETYHDILIVQRHMIFSNLGFNDGYAIPAAEIQYFKFIYDNHQFIIVDNNGHRYKRISNEIDISSQIAEYYIGSIIFAPLIDSAQVNISGDIVSVVDLNRNLRIFLPSWFMDGANLELLETNAGRLALVIKNGRYIFYKTGQAGPMHDEMTDEIAFEIQVIE